MSDGINPAGMIAARLAEIQGSVTSFQKSGAGRQVAHDLTPYIGELVLAGETWSCLVVSEMPSDWLPAPKGTPATEGRNQGEPYKSTRSARLVSKVTSFLSSRLPADKRARDISAYGLSGGTLAPMGSQDDTVPTLILWHVVDKATAGPDTSEDGSASDGQSEDGSGTTTVNNPTAETVSEPVQGQTETAAA